MKKILTILLLAFSLGLCSCSELESEKVNDRELEEQEVVENKFKAIDRQNVRFVNDGIYYVYDKDTLVEYIIVISTKGYGKGCSITPRYNADGSLMIHKE